MTAALPSASREMGQCRARSAPPGNGQPVAVLRPYGPEDTAAYPFRTDPMGIDETTPTFSGDPGFSEQVDDLLAGFGRDG